MNQESTHSQDQELTPGPLTYPSHASAQNRVCQGGKAATFKTKEINTMRCRQNSDSVLAERNGSHRAKVRVQRRANSNQKVVTLSVDQAVEVGALSLPRAKRTSVMCPAGTEQAETKTSCRNLESRKVTGTLTLSTAKNRCGNVRESENTEGIALEVAVPASNEEALTSVGQMQVLSESEVTSAEESAPPPPPPPRIRSRQAWASPTTSSRKPRDKPSEVTTGTNTVNKPVALDRWMDGDAKVNGDGCHNPPKIVQHSSPDADNDTCNGSNIVRKTEEHEEVCNSYASQGSGISLDGATSEAVPANRKQKLGVRKKLTKGSFTPDKDNGTAAVKDRQSKTRSETKDEKEDERAASSKSKKGDDLQRRDRGDGTHNQCPKHLQLQDNATTVLEKPVDSQEQVKPCESTDQSTTLKKKSSSFFSWRPFRKNSKSAKGTSEVKETTEMFNKVKKRPTQRGVAKTSMASDILKTQGSVSIPSLTEMFAASK